MTNINATPFPLFLTYDEVTTYLGDVPLDDTLMFAGHRIVPVTVIAPGLGLNEIHEVIWLNEPDNVDSVNTTDGPLIWEYAEPHVLVVVALAKQHGIRAWDAAAFIAQQIFPELTVLDSTGTAVTTLDALPKHYGVDQRSFHWLSNFPLSVAPPAWFPKSGMPNVEFHPSPA
ncbi:MULTISPECIES: hypothetical protein [unclassified Microbacterium]|uniref:hypothetical protein n=1 Tax=unclassified Microbacterium TaxID=2609290 RepID=UPI002469B74F|nr:MULTISPECIES: hypothetical protein [unclassified Microbacterium]MDH5134584.1 hypothetical protein [Microbacterium sp. RD10]MDH5138138.1 hypothetical protein [Microbacterium sp. RD11]MDH5146250.1 hypothetical protein [Microbacterium sp. RD12]MDH5156480.1 hypothetical protein [Microbacterium sp. RD06]MDH5167869.1 hypothetical protein [Microbacterium sp. RD02]